MSPSAIRRLVRNVACGLALILAGCSSSGAPPAGCPSVRLLGDTARITAFAPTGGESIRDIAATARITKISGTCHYDSERRLVRMGVSIQVTGQRGPAFEGAAVDLPFFVAVVTGRQEILAKSVFQSRLAFVGDQFSASSTEKMETDIPIAPGRGPTDYQVLVGFQLTPAELQYNQRRPAGR